MARTIYIWCIYDISGTEITRYTVIDGVYIWFWPTLLKHDATHTCLQKSLDFTHTQTPARLTRNVSTEHTLYPTYTLCNTHVPIKISGLHTRRRPPTLPGMFQPKTHYILLIHNAPLTCLKKSLDFTHTQRPACLTRNVLTENTLYLTYT